MDDILWMIYCGSFLNISYFCILSLNIRKIFIFPCFLIIPPFTIFTALYVVPALSNNIFINMSYATSENDMVLISNNVYSKISYMLGNKKNHMSACILNSNFSENIIITNPKTSWSDDNNIFFSLKNEDSISSIEIPNKEISISKNIMIPKLNIKNGILEKCKI